MTAEGQDGCAPPGGFVERLQDNDILTMPQDQWAIAEAVSSGEVNGWPSTHSLLATAGAAALGLTLAQRLRRRVRLREEESDECTEAEPRRRGSTGRGALSPLAQRLLGCQPVPALAMVGGIGGDEAAAPTPCMSGPLAKQSSASSSNTPTPPTDASRPNPAHALSTEPDMTTMPTVEEPMPPTAKTKSDSPSSPWITRIWCVLLLALTMYFGATAPEVQQWAGLADGKEAGEVAAAASVAPSRVTLVSEGGASLHPASATSNTRAAETFVEGGARYHALAIANLQVGMQALGQNPEVSDAARATFAPIDPATSRVYHLRMVKDNGTTLEMELLRPESWLTQAFNARLDPTGDGVFVELPELGIMGDAELLDTRPCPPLGAGAASAAGTITGRFIHTGDEIVSVTFNGSDTPIGVTPNHPFWDPIAQEFKPIGEFAVGDQVLGRQGLVTLTNIERRAGPVTVYNIETHGEHVYRVAATGLLVHNAGDDYVPILRRGMRTKVYQNGTKIWGQRNGRAARTREISQGMPSGSRTQASTATSS